MKKLMIMAIVAAMMVIGVSAYADCPCPGCDCACDTCLTGTINILNMCLKDSDSADIPNGDCCLLVSFNWPAAGGIYTVPMVAYGTQINLALLKAFNAPEPVDVCVELGMGPSIIFRIKQISVPATI